ncbi:TetR/AcrR family transcriptional regulator [Microbacterium sp.]|uniref:TetR/AcrR family transcriptional regulator n=1 Tax=Microbacterium sp. TaxID=51671 RepID=UPI002FE15BE0
MPRPLVADRRDRILDATESLTLARGFDAVTVADIATASGIGKGAVYLEFAGKREILDALLRRAVVRTDARVREEIGDDPRLSTAYRATARAVLADPLLTAAFLDDDGVLGQHADAVSDARYRARHLGVIDRVRDLQHRGLVVSTIEPEHLALALSSATIGLLSAARLVGPIGTRELEGAIDAIGTMAAAFETD